MVGFPLAHDMSLQLRFFGNPKREFFVVECNIPVALSWKRCTVYAANYSGNVIYLIVQELMLPRNSPATEWRHAVASQLVFCLFHPVEQTNLDTLCHNPSPWL